MENQLEASAKLNLSEWKANVEDPWKSPLQPFQPAQQSAKLWDYSLYLCHKQ